MQAIGHFLVRGAILAAIAVAPCHAQSQAARSWTSFTTGFGLARASMRGDTIYAGSGQVFARLGYARQLTAQRALEIEVLGGRPFGTGDCTDFSICAPAFNVVGASASVLTSFGGVIAPNRILAGAGVGFFRVAPTEDHALPPRPAVGFQASLDVPLIVGSRAAFVVGLRGHVWPTVHSQTLGVGLLTAGVRAW